jgi:hypothetical protein
MKNPFRPRPKASARSVIRRRIWIGIGVVLLVFFGLALAGESFSTKRTHAPASGDWVFTFVMLTISAWVLWYGLSVPLTAEEEADRAKKRKEFEEKDSARARLVHLVRWVVTPIGILSTAATIALAVLAPTPLKMVPVLLYSRVAASASTGRNEPRSK